MRAGRRRERTSDNNRRRAWRPRSQKRVGCGCSSLPLFVPRVRIARKPRAVCRVFSVANASGQRPRGDIPYLQTMTATSPTKTRRGMEAFASRDFKRYQLARVTAIVGAEAQSVAVAWQVYSITHRAIDLGYTGLALFLPGLLFLLPAGHVADRFDRRRVIMACYALQCFCTAALVVLARNNTQNILAIYTVLFFVGTGRAFSGPAGSALIPHLVPERHFVNAVTWGGAIFQLANITGPALGGLLFTFPLMHFVPGSRLQGAGIVYVFTLVTLGWFLVLVSTLHVRPGRMEHRATS